MEVWRNVPILWVRGGRYQERPVGKQTCWRLPSCGALWNAGAHVWVRAARNVWGVCCSSLVFASAALRGAYGHELWLSGRSGVWSSIATDLLSIDVG